MKLELISKYRTHIMGAAMMWIMFFHSPYYDGGEAVQFLHRIGFYGVDIFLLVSGLGLYYSMRKSKNVLDYYRKRAVRILPAYLIVTICWYLFFKTQVAPADKILSILGVNYFRGTLYGRPEYFDWFIPTLIVFYLLLPLYDLLFRQTQAKWKLTLLASVISPVLCLIGYHTNQQVLYGSFTRIPIFLIGYCIGWFLYEKKEEQKGSWMVHIALLTVGLILGYQVQTGLSSISNVMWGLNTYPALLVAPALAVILGFVFLYAQKWLRIIGEILLFPFYICGRYSLEIYLIHQRLMEIMNSDALTGLRSAVKTQVGNNAYHLLLALATVVFAAALHELIALVIRLIKRAGKSSPGRNNGEHTMAESA